MVFDPDSGFHISDGRLEGGGGEIRAVITVFLKTAGDWAVTTEIRDPTLSAEAATDAAAECLANDRDDDSDLIGTVRISISRPYLDDDGIFVGPGASLVVTSTGIQPEEELLTYASNFLLERLAPSLRPDTYVERVMRAETWPWEELVFPPGTKVRPRDGGPEGTVEGHGVDGVFVTGPEDVYGFWPPWELVPATRL